jgi:predicted HAD superfamily Cof-like phosphohydrolase
MSSLPLFHQQPRSLHQHRIDQLMQKAGQELPASPRIPDEPTRLLRAKLILEECLETIRALGFNPSLSFAQSSKLGVPVCEPSPKDGLPITIQDVIFAPRDLHVVNPDHPHSAMATLVEIADGCADISVVTIGTLSACGIADLPILEAVDDNNLQKFGPGGYRREDGKWIKPPGHKPPDLRSLIIAQMGK